MKNLFALYVYQVCLFQREFNVYLLFSSNPSWSQPSTEDQDAISPDGNDDISQDIESTLEPDMDQDDSHSQGQEASPEPEADQDDSISQNTGSTQGSEMEQNDSDSRQGKEPTPEPETDQVDSICRETESTQGSEMEQNDPDSQPRSKGKALGTRLPDSHLGKQPAPEPEVNEDNETFSSAF